MLNPEQWERALQVWLEDLAESFFQILPTLVGFLIGLTLAVILGRLVGMATTRLFRRLGLDRMSDRSGLTLALQKSSFLASPSYMLGILARWTVFLLAIILTIEWLGIGEAEGTFGFIVRFLPNLFVALVIMVFGVMLAGVVASWLEATLEGLGVRAPQSTGLLLRYSIIVIISLVVLQQLGIDTLILSVLVLVLVGTLLIGVVITLALSARLVASNLIASVFVRRQFPIGSHVWFEGTRHRVVRCGSMMLTLEADGEEIHVPHRVVISKIMK